MPQENKVKSLIVIPTYNEALNISALLEEISKYVPSAHILVVDDNSQDGTSQLVKDSPGFMLGSVFILERQGKLGLGTAYIAGFQWALKRGYQAVVEIDADFSHEPKELPAMLDLLRKYPVVVGSRYIQGGGTQNWNPWRKLISRCGSWYARTILGMRVRDLTGGYNAWKADVLKSIELEKVGSEGYSFQIELKYRAFRAGYEIKEHPITFLERREGHSKMSGKIVLEAFYRVWLLRFTCLVSQQQKIGAERASTKA